MYLLDTNVCVQFLRNRHALVVQRINARRPDELRLCSIVVAELFHGCLCSAQPAVNRAQVDAFIRPYQSLPFDDSAADVHAHIRRHLEKLGMPIGPYDLQIAAIALVHGATLVTHNSNEFSRVPNLVIEDWEIP
jgi:tRNA(fMet)-specific endonuclease VapC